MCTKVKNHHTVADWDFSAGTPKSLDATIYVSPPSSLKITGAAVPSLARPALCRIAETQCIAQGEVRTWHRVSDITWPNYLVFRNQAALGSADILNTYLWVIFAAIAYLRVRVAGIEGDIGNVPVSRANNTWEHWRTTYSIGLDPAGDPAIIVKLYREVAAEWVQQGSTLYDTQNRWATSSINRSGIGCAERTGKLYYWDDTEIWGLV